MHAPELRNVPYVKWRLAKKIAERPNRPSLATIQMVIAQAVQSSYPLETWNLRDAAAVLLWADMARRANARPVYNTSAPLAHAASQTVVTAKKPPPAGVGQTGPFYGGIVPPFKAAPTKAKGPPQPKPAPPFQPRPRPGRP